jgi:hypothetical protein
MSALTPSAAPARPRATDLRVEEIAIDDFVARVLARAHRGAHVRAAPDEARLILDLAHMFADEMAGTGVPFDREQFIDAVMQDRP